jgi:hypothetical protein
MNKLKPLEGKENLHLRSRDTHENEKNAAWADDKDKDKAEIAASQAKEWVDNESRL